MKTSEAFCIGVPKNQGEKAFRMVGKIGIANRDLIIRSDEKSIYIPLVRQPNDEESEIMKAQIPDFTLQKQTFFEKLPQKSLKDILENQIEPALLSKIPQAFDAVGDIAIVEIRSELKQHEKLIGRAILESHPKIKTVYSKAGAVKGKYRLRELVLIAGEQKSVTTHKEFDCTYRVDVVNAYFSPRLSQEHKRIASLVQKGETIVDLFAGVGPFSVLAAKANPDAKIYAIDINPEAVKLLETNARLNRVENQIVSFLGDAGKIVEDNLRGVANRAIMNLPESAIEFVKAACMAINPIGGVVHFYGFARRPLTLEDVQRQLSMEVEKSGRKVDRFLCARKIRETAPFEWQIVLDAAIL